MESDLLPKLYANRIKQNQRINYLEKSIYRPNCVFRFLSFYKSIILIEVRKEKPLLFSNCNQANSTKKLIRLSFYKDIFRKYPNRYENIISTLCENLDSLDEPEARASMIWIIGEYAERIDNADELLHSFLDGFQVILLAYVGAKPSNWLFYRMTIGKL